MTKEASMQKWVEHFAGEWVGCPLLAVLVNADDVARSV